MSNFNLIRKFGLVSLFCLSSLAVESPVNAFTITFNNPDFENGLTGFNTAGDVSIQQGFQGITPVNGSINQALITNSCPGAAFPSGQCFDTQDPSNFRQDDSIADNTRTFNFSGSDQTNANPSSGADLQTFLGLEPDALNIPRTGGLIPGLRDPSEGSAITQTFTVSDPFRLSFDFNFLTNDGTNTLLGNQDFAFVTLFEQGSDSASRTIEILADSSGTITTPIDMSQTEFEREGGFTSFESDVTLGGTFTVGIGVVDVDGTGISSGLLVDNFQVEEVPFDFSPIQGLGILLGLFFWKRFRQKLQSRLPDQNL